MKALSVQAFVDGTWHDAAIVELHKPELGHRSPSTVGYEDSYFFELGLEAFNAQRPLRDFRAYSVAAPLDLARRSADSWPPFLLDFLPQGRQAERIAKFLDLPPGAPGTQIRLIEESAGSPVGNLRIKEAYEKQTERIARTPRVGISMDDILKRSDVFMEVADRFSMLAAGSNGLQGDWPKVAMTQASDGLWYPDPLVADESARTHVIVKLLRSGQATDQRILEAEGAYSLVAREFGLDVAGVSSYGHGVLVVPRFDRAVDEHGIHRYGQESLVSAIGVAGFSHSGRHETYLRAIQEISADPLQDTIEYLLRDLMNLAMGNPDNHGRNTALRKFPDGRVRLAPLFDFAPMRIDASSIPRATKWECMLSRGLDSNPDWEAVCEAVARPDVPAEALMAALAEKEEAIRSLPDLARKHGVPASILDHIIRSDDMADGLAKLRASPNYR